MKHATSGMSKSTRARMPAYCRCLRELLLEGHYRVSSEELGRRLGMSSAQVRVDIQRFACAGVSGYGYGVKPLYTEIAALLGIGEGYTAVSIGKETRMEDLPETEPCGRYGVRILAHLAESDGAEALRETLGALCPDIGILDACCRDPRGLASLLIAGGVRGILNYTDVILPETEGISIRNHPMSDDLMLLSGAMKTQGEESK